MFVPIGQPLSGSPSSTWIEGEASQDLHESQRSSVTNMKGHRGDFRLYQYSAYVFDWQMLLLLLLCMTKQNRLSAALYAQAS